VAINPFSRFLNIYFNRVTTILYFYSSSSGVTTPRRNIAECGLPLFILTAEPYTALTQRLPTAALSVIHFRKIYRAIRYSEIVQLKYLALTSRNSTYFCIWASPLMKFPVPRQCSHYWQRTSTKDAARLLMKTVSVFAAKHTPTSLGTLIASNNLLFLLRQV